MILDSENQQLNVLKDQAIRKLSVVDFDLNGYDVSSDETFVKLGYNATKNKVLFWLNMNLGDVVRSTEVSPLVQLLGQTLIDDNVQSYQDDIEDAFTERFSEEDLQLAYINLEINLSNRTWFLQMTVRDNITDSLIPLNLEITQ